MRHVTPGGAACALLFSLSASAPLLSAQTTGKIPITTSSDEARQAYVKGRDLQEKLRATDAHALYEQAVAKDANFALAYVGLANTAGTTKEFIDAATKAASLVGSVSEGERHIILAMDAGLKNQPDAVLQHFKDLVASFPNDERAQNLLANVYFVRQDYNTAIEHFVKATTINPSFSQPYNQLGYAYRFIEKYDEAEKTFKKYTELIPDDPNPYDSYAELLMKRGRFEESIKSYQKALSIDPNFVASYIGIGNDYQFMGRSEDARAAFTKIDTVARNTGEHRLAHFWMAASYVQDGATDKAVGEIKAQYALAEKEHDGASMSGDLNQMGDILREAGRLDEASAKYAEAVSTIDKADVPQQLKDATHRNYLFEQGRLAVAKNDLPTAKAKASEYATQIAVRKVPFEVRQSHELSGLINLADKRPSAAVEEFKQSNQQDPRIIYLTSVAAQQAGDTQGAATLATKAAKFNGLSFNYGYIKAKVTKTMSTGAQ
jgi:tetratricopeptide (TPR) repeat protein